MTRGPETGGAGAGLAPGTTGRQAAVLLIENSLTFKADATYASRLYPNRILKLTLSRRIVLGMTSGTRQDT